MDGEWRRNMPSDKKRMTVLDCTLRDGGYYNNWDFHPALVSRYLGALKTAGVDAVEIGFRTLSHDGFMGAFAYSHDEMIRSLPIPEGMPVGVMINAKEFLSPAAATEELVRSVFNPASESPVQFVRVAVHPEQALECKELLSILKKLGYQVCLNLMQISQLDIKTFEALGNEFRESGVIDVFYLADSFGNVSPARVREMVETLNKSWRGPVGLHAHDNMGQALGNALAAEEAGAAWIDGTVLGMGRGAGNTCTELLLLELNRRGHDHYYADALFPIVMEDFEPLKKKYEWGSNLLYYLSGMYDIHPTYIQEMLGKTKFETEKILSGLEYLRNSKAASYKNDRLKKAMNHSPQPCKGTWSAKKWLKGRDLLILASGPKLENYADEIKRFIKKSNPLVLSLNINRFIPQEYITAYAACHKTRLLMDADKYRSLKKPILAPLNAIPEIIKHKFQNLEVWNYAMSTSEDVFTASESECQIPVMLVAAYAFAVAAGGGASRVLLAGFDGYEFSDARYREMEHVLELYRLVPNSPPLLSVTPTTYSIPMSSIYSPLFHKIK